MRLGKDKRALILASFLLITATSIGQAGKSYKYQFNGSLQKSDVRIGNESLIINYSISEINIENIFNGSDSYYRVTIPGHTSSSLPGKPELPVFSRLITIPEGSDYSVKISEIHSRKISPESEKFEGLLFPAQASETKSRQKKPNFVMDKKTYATRGLISSDTVQIDPLGIVRNKKLSTIIISPVRYNPHSNELDVITSMKIEIIFSNLNNKSIKSLTPESALFTESLDKGVLNYANGDLIPGFTNQPVKMVIITDTAYKKQLEPFFRWKTQKGFKLNILYMGAGKAGNTSAQLKDTLTKIYRAATTSDPPPEYLLIIGDVNKVPNYGTTNITDMYYGEFDGNGDYMPEMFIGRLPVSDTTEVKAVVNKIIQYEKFQFADTNTFYSRAIASAGYADAFSKYMNGQIKYAVSNYLTKSNQIDESHYYYYARPKEKEAELLAITKDSIIMQINKGVSFLNYTGHGDATTWLHLNISMDTSIFRNKNMYPFMISNACRTAQFNLPNSLGNRMVVTGNKGAIGFIGCSNDSYWDEDFYWSVGAGTPSAEPTYQTTGLGAYDRLFHTHNESPSNWYFTMGQIVYSGNLAVSASTSSWKRYYWETYNLVGDPSVIPILGKPGKFSISLPDTLPNNLKSLFLNVDPFAYVAVSHFDKLWDASYASPSGSVSLDLPGLSNDSCLIVITGQNKIPIIKTIHFAEVNKAYINLTSSSINDSTANNNNLADYGESFFLKLAINNLGVENSSGLYAKLTTTSNLISIVNDSVNIGSLAGKSQIILNKCFGIKVAALVTDKSYVTLNLSLIDSKTIKNYTIDISLHAPVLDLLNCLIDDSGTGNGNSFAEPGETLKLLFKVRNSGSSVISGTFNILDHSTGIIINQPLVNTGLIKPGEISVIPVSARMAPDILRAGLIEISALLDCSPYIISKTLTIPIGKINESFEYQKFTTFPWANSSAYPWTISGNQAIDGQYSARSGAISHNGESVLKMIVNAPVKDTVRFSVKVSSEFNWDYLNFSLNGNQVFKISGEEDWTLKKVALREGLNLLEWSYKKDPTKSSGSDCAWLDNIIFPFNAFNRIDLKTGKVVAPQPNKSYSNEPITAEVINFGTDTLKSFYLAYQINKNAPFVQKFTKKINPGDTTVVSFSQTADLASIGTYVIKVYGLNNNDGYPLNDTAKMSIINTSIFTPADDPASGIIISPNPFKQSFRIEFDSDYTEETRISIVDQSGRIIWNRQQEVLPGQNTLSFLTENIPAGIFNLQIKGKHISKVARIIRIE